MKETFNGYRTSTREYCDVHKINLVSPSAKREHSACGVSDEIDSIAKRLNSLLDKKRSPAVTRAITRALAELQDAYIDAHIEEFNAIREKIDQEKN